MRGKGLITFFSIALILICLYQLSFNFVTSNAEKKAQNFAENSVLNGKSIGSALPANNAVVKDSLLLQIRKKRQVYLDSISNQTIYNIGIAKYTYQDCKDQQLNLGLDLQGGMNVVLQVSIADLIKGLADNSTDPTFIKALELTKVKLRAQPEADFVTLFGQAWNEVAPNGKLASVFSTRSNQDKIKFNSTNEEVLKFIKTEESGSFDRTFNILRSRIDKFGVTQPNITAQPTTGRIIVELPGVDNPKRVRKLLQASAILEFWETYDNQDFHPYLEAANTALKNHLSLSDTTAKKDSSDNPLVNGGLNASNNPLQSVSDSDKSSELNASAIKDTGSLTNKDTSATAAADAQRGAKDNPLFTILSPNLYQDPADNQVKWAPSPMVGKCLGRDTARVNEYLQMDFIRANFPRDVKFLWSAKPYDAKNNVYELYAIKKPVGTDKAPLEGDQVTSARQDVDLNGNQEVSMSMNNQGAKTWKIMTSKNINKYIAIVLDDYVYSAPKVNGEIPNGRSSITGGFSVDEAKDLANILQTGKLPAPASIIAEDVVGPSLGQESIQAGIRSIVIAFIAILVFMVLYYGSSGIISDIALFFNLFFIVGVLASLGATLTLPGIAGIVLTMGMAVDANVLIHERIKEELAKGKNLAKAVSDGHTKSYSAVFDTHLTTLITGLILAYFGLGPVLGYATTLNIGVIMTLFTAVFLAHLIFDWMLKRGMNIKFSTPVSRFNLTNLNIQFVNKRKYAYIISGTLAVIGLISIFTKGFDYGVDFSGGRSYIVQFDQDVTTESVKAELTNAFGGVAPEVKTYGANNKVKITTGYNVNETTSRADSIVNAKLFSGLQKFVGNEDYDTFLKKNQLSSQVVGPSISADILHSAYKAILFSLIGIFLYILLRFRKWQFALGAIISLAHDVLMVMGAYSLLHGIVPFSLEVDESFVAACLTVMGYSVADTVIVFDRIREFLREHPLMDTKKTINDAINMTLNRTVITSSTVLLVLLILFIFGGDVIRGFSFALLLGISFGTYSSIFVATPIVVDLTRKKVLKAETPQSKRPVPVK
ncbi:MAG: protein translocase subunit SecDF [Chitinophagales bacterium]|nr:protein translocase subunit SecDF [Chitinophagales bacterium]